jgi:hypothetical protein
MIATTIVLKSISCVFHALIVARAVLFLKLAFRLQPLVQVVAQVATVAATLDVNLKRPPMDFVQGWDVLTYLFRNVRPNTSRPRVLSIRGQILRVHVLFSFPKCSLTSTGRLQSPNPKSG